MGTVDLPRAVIFIAVRGDEHYGYSKTNIVTLRIKQNRMIFVEIKNCYLLKCLPFHFITCMLFESCTILMCYFLEK